MKTEKGSIVPPNIELQSDPQLGVATIVASFRTARELRKILGPDMYHIECGEHFPDELVAVSPDLYDAFHQFVTNLSDSHHAV